MDPRVAHLIGKYARARGDRFLGRVSGGRLPSSEELAGWALERAGHDPLVALGVLRKYPIPTAQREGASRLLRPLLTSTPITSRSGAAAAPDSRRSST